MKTLSSFRLESFRADLSPQQCRSFIEGHSEAVRTYSVVPEKHFDTSWRFESSVYGILVKSDQHEKALGGVRVHIHTPSTELPFIHCLRKIDPEKIPHLDSIKGKTIAEVCSIWRSPENPFPILSRLLTRESIKLAHSIGVDILFGFAGIHSVGLLEQEGFGYNKTFTQDIAYPYPDSRYQSRICFLDLQEQAVNQVPIPALRPKRFVRSA